ncbi:MAG: tetratricopeptide repeat protein [Chthoniobacterales bacterium]
MPDAASQSARLEIAHVLFLDLVGYSKLLVNQQTELLRLLNDVVRSTEQFRTAEAADKLVRLPTGDGMALVFFTSPDAPVRCAMEIDRKLKEFPQLNVRMGIHSGPVDVVRDVNDRTNVTGAGINMAQRVMDCGDAGHILLSKRVADDLGQYEHWQPHLYDLGECEVKHGVKLEVVNFFDGEAGTPELPEKFKRKHEAHALESRAVVLRRRRKLIYLSMAIILVALSATFAFRFFKAGDTETKSIAILPFKPLVAESADEVLEMGMADTLITKLSGSGNIIVPSLSSVRAVFGTDPLTAGRKLGVSFVLEGSVQKAADRLRVSARLLRVADGTSIWSKTFDKNFTDVFSVQDTISQELAQALSIRLDADAQKHLTKRHTDNIAAYQLYLAGRFHWNKFTPPDFRKSIEYFEQAVQMDPDYALAYFGLGDAYRALGMTGEGPPVDFFPKATSALNKALQIDDSLCDAHATLSVVHVFFDWDWAAAEEEARRAIALDPSSGAAHSALAQVLSSTGRHEEALREAARSHELDRISPINNVRDAAFLYFARHYEEAIARLQQTVELDPNFFISHYYLGKTYLELGRNAEAQTAFAKAVELSHRNPDVIGALAYFFGRTGDRSQAQALLAQLQTVATQRYVAPYHIALTHAALGEADEAMTWLEKGFAERDPRMSWLKVEPSWDAFRDNPRFVALVKQLGFN